MTDAHEELNQTPEAPPAPPEREAAAPTAPGAEEAPEPNQVVAAAIPAPGTYTCDVIIAGPGTGGVGPGQVGVAIGLQDRANHWSPWTYFHPAPGLEVAMLATALTAISTGFPVDAHLADIVQGSQINNLYVHSKWAP